MHRADEGRGLDPDALLPLRGLAAHKLRWPAWRSRCSSAWRWCRALHPHRHDQPVVRRHLRAGARRAPTSWSRRRRSCARTWRSRRRSPPSLLERVRGCRGSRPPTGGVNALVRLVDDENEDLGNGFAPNFVFSVVPEPFDPSPTPRAARRAARARRRSTRARPSARGLGIGDRSAWPATRRRALPGRRHQQARRRLHRRLELGHAHAARGPARHRPARQVRPDLDRGRRRGVAPEQLKRASRGCCRAPCAPRPASENADREGDEIARTWLPSRSRCWCSPA